MTFLKQWGQQPREQHMGRLKNGIEIIKLNKELSK